MFDPYRRWLSIPEQFRPPTHYQLLGVDPAEQDREVIEAAVIRQSAYLRNFQKGPNADAATQLLNEVAAAKICLLDAAKRAAYDAGLKQAIAIVAPAAPQQPAAKAAARPPVKRPARPAKIELAPRPDDWLEKALAATELPTDMRMSSRRKPIPAWMLVAGSLTAGALLMGMMLVLGSGRSAPEVAAVPVEEKSAVPEVQAKPSQTEVASPVVDTNPTPTLDSSIEPPTSTKGAVAEPISDPKSEAEAPPSRELPATSPPLTPMEPPVAAIEPPKTEAEPSRMAEPKLPGVPKDRARDRLASLPVGETARAVRPVIDSSKLSRGLLVTEYPRLPSQDSKGGGFVPLEQLEDPIGAPFVIGSLTNWNYNPARNAVAEGLLKVDVGGEYRFLSHNFYDRNALYIDGAPVCGYRDGEQTVAKIDLEPGLIPIASLGYVQARGSIGDVQWAPPGQAALSEIPRDRLFFTAEQKAKRVADVKIADEKRRAAVSLAKKVDNGAYRPGLRELRYARLASQVPKGSGAVIVPIAELGKPLGAPKLIKELSPWKADPEQNVIAFGYLRIDRPGEYAFWYTCGWNRCRVFIDGQLLWGSEGGEEIVHRVSLEPGFVPFMAISYPPNPQLPLLWQPPGQAELGPVAKGALWHDPAVTSPENLDVAP